MCLFLSILTLSALALSLGIHDMVVVSVVVFFFFSSRRRHTRLVSDWSSDVCSSDLFAKVNVIVRRGPDGRMQVRQEPIPEMPAELKQIIRSEERRVGKEGRGRGGQ